jgi:hypothetical protein
MTEAALTDALETVEVPEASYQPAPEDSPKSEPAYIDTLVGDGKKYSSTDELAKAYHHASLHIEELKGDLQEFKGGKEALNELLDEIRNSKPEESNDTPAPPQAPVETQIQTEDVAKIVNDQFMQREATAKAEANVATSMNKLVEVYGSEMQVKAAVTKAVGSDESVKNIIDNLSRSNPETTVKFITGIVPTSEMDVSNTPAVNNSSGEPQPFEGQLTWAKCREVKKDNPRIYKSAAFRKQIEVAAAEAAEKGVDFFAT